VSWPLDDRSSPLLVGAVCLTQSKKTLKYLPEGTRLPYRKLYNVIGGAMILLPAGAFVLGKLINLDTYTFWAELAGIVVFAAYWALKGYELSSSHLDQKIFAGNIETIS
tara:strand:- start:3019 stop:3345 length:327 start_codon:yes stop_codon:yes gene_type:complete